MNSIVVFSGHAHPELARALCKRLKVPLSSSTTTTFSNDCLGVQLEANCREADVFIVQPLVPPVQHHLMELLLMLDAARGASAARITAVIPHFAYARSDKKDAPRISIAARLVADLLVTAGANRVLAMTLHSPQVHGFFSVPVDHMNALKVLARHFRPQKLKNTVVVSPDLGNAKEASHFARSLALPMAAGSKKRLSDARVVDVLCGYGRHSLDLAARGFDVGAVDLSPDMIVEARRSAVDAGLEISWRLASPKRGRFLVRVCGAPPSQRLPRRS
jgi:ribose-phosphate pyrophosphokinase